MTAEFINGVLHKHRDPARASQMKAYMKNHFEFMGISSPDRKSILRDILKGSRKLNKDEIIALIHDLWESPERESQYAAMLLIDANLKKFDKLDIVHAEDWITTKSWWDTVDHLASHLVGRILDVAPEIRDETIDKWMVSENMWLQRTCLLFQLSYREQTDFDLLKSMIEDLRLKNEFFIQKAIGWALRQYSKTNAFAVREFVDETQLSGLASREAMKWLKRHK